MQKLDKKQSEQTEDIRFIQDDLIKIVSLALNRNFDEELDALPKQLNLFQDALKTDFVKGLKGDDFEQRSNYYGTNRKPSSATKNYWGHLLTQFFDIKAFLLLLTSVVEIVIGNITDIDRMIFLEGATILAIVIVVCSFLAFTEYQQDKQLFELQQMKEYRNTINVWRNGQLTSLIQSNLMVGDIVQIKEGMDIPCDCLLLEGEQLLIDERLITGNTDPVKKDISQNCISIRDRIVAEGNKNCSTPYDVPSPIIFSGTKVVQGEGKMLVLVVGTSSVMGKIQSIVVEEKEEQTIFEAKLDQTADKIKRFSQTIVGLTFLVLLVRQIQDGLKKQLELQDFIEFIRNVVFGITLLIFVNPYGLMKILTYSTSFSITRALSDNILVRKVSSFQTLGFVDQILTDKTGTLTQNRLRVVTIWNDIQRQIDPQSQQSTLGQLGSKDIQNLIVKNMILNNPAEQGIGSGTDQSFKYLIEKCNWIDYDEFRQNYLVKERIPFSSSRKRQSAIVDDHLFQYGAIELVLQACTKYYSDKQGLIDIDNQLREKLEQEIQNMGNQALRTIALAYKEISKDDDLEKVNPNGLHEIEKSNLTLLCFVGIKDPLRQGITKSIKQMQTAGIKVRMITGDNMLTAKVIGQECGILINEGESSVLAGNQFMSLTGGLVCSQCQTQQCEHTNKPYRVEVLKNKKAFEEIVPTLDILARSTPEDKYALVAGLQGNGHIVAVTEEGTNDAPALAKADVGIGMGIEGTEIARESSDLLLLDDNFNSILKGILWSRNISESVKKFIQFQLTLNLVVLFLTFIGALLIKQQVLSPIQILWISLIMDIFASITLATESPNQQLLERQPDNLKSSLINPKMVKHIIGQIVFQVLVLSIIIFYGEQFIPEVQNNFDQQYPNQLQYKYSNIQILPNSQHYHCNYVNTCTLIASGRIYHLNGDEDYIKFYKTEQIPSRHFTFIFNTLVLMSIFNYINSRKTQDELNVFKGLFGNYFQLIFIFGTFLAQVIIVTFGNIIFGCYPYYGLTVIQWIMCIVIASGVLIIRLLLRSLPDFNWYGSNNNRIRDNKHKSKIE